MVALNLLTSSVSNISNLQNLALFICHLFIDGHIRIGHIIQDPNVFDGQLNSKMNSVCPIQIPCLTTDITQSFSLPWSANDRTDHILQLIFFDPNNLANQIDQLKNTYTFYRVLIFFINADQNELKNRIRSIVHLNSVVLEYNLKADSVSVFQVFESGEGSNNIDNVEQNAFIQLDQATFARHDNLFDTIFGEFEAMRPLNFQASGVFWKLGDFSTLIPFLGYIYRANYFFTAFNISYFNWTYLLYTDSNVVSKYYLSSHKQRKYHKELLIDYDPVKDDKM